MTLWTTRLSPEVLDVDPRALAIELETEIRRDALSGLGRRGVVVPLSGGLDSAVTCALVAQAVGKERVLALFMPDRDSRPEALRAARAVAERLGVRAILEDLAPALNSLGCYARQDEAVRMACPEYDESWGFRMGASPAAAYGFALTIERPSGEAKRVGPVPLPSSLQLLAAGKLKARVRTAVAYYHAERFDFAVAGTENRVKYALGLGGDHADLWPLARVYRGQEQALAAHLGLPAELYERPSSTDLFPLPVSASELYFALSAERLDLCLYAFEHDVRAEEAARAVDLAPAEVLRLYQMMQARRDRASAARRGFVEDAHARRP